MIKYILLAKQSTENRAKSISIGSREPLPDAERRTRAPGSAAAGNEGERDASARRQATGSPQHPRPRGPRSPDRVTRAPPPSHPAAAGPPPTPSRPQPSAGRPSPGPRASASAPSPEAARPRAHPGGGARSPRLQPRGHSGRRLPARSPPGPLPSRG